MKHSSLLPSLFGVMLLGLVHLELKDGNTPVSERPFTNLVAAVALLVGSGAVFAPLVKKADEPPGPETSPAFKTTISISPPSS